MKIAIVHDWLVTYAGAERVLESMLTCFPEADLYSLVDFLDAQSRGFLRGKTVTQSFIAKMPRAKSSYRNYLPLMPLAIEQFDLSKYDVIITSSHAVAKGVLVGPDQLHICMCYSPIRYAWDLQFQYLSESGLESGIKSWIVRYILHRMRIWDARSSDSVDQFIAISNFISRRIKKAYRRNSSVIYPPVNTEIFELRENKDDFYLTASRLVPYKKIPCIIEAFAATPHRRLFVIGEGPDLKRCKEIATPNVEVLGWQSSAVLRDYMQRAKGFIFAAEEDFGIIPIEAQACGTPVIAYGKGAAIETIRGLESDNPTGAFFYEQTPEAIGSALDLFESEKEKISPHACRQNAVRFSADRFLREFRAFVNSSYSDFFDEKTENST